MIFFLTLFTIPTPTIVQGQLIVEVSSKSVHVGTVSMYPNSELTPGKTNPILTQELICSKGFRTGPYRKVTKAEKKQVFIRYGIPWENRGQYEVDHFISLELGGSNDIENLWPQAYEPIPGARQKDVTEDYLHKEMCGGKITQQQAQQAVLKDWYLIYVELKGGTHQ